MVLWASVEQLSLSDRQEMFATFEGALLSVGRLVEPAADELQHVDELPATHPDLTSEQIILTSFCKKIVFFTKKCKFCSMGFIKVKPSV